MFDPDSVFHFDHVLTPAECDAWIQRTETIGYEAAPVSTALGAVMMPDVRNNDRVMFDDVDAAEELWSRIDDQLPERWQEVKLEDDTWRSVGLNERFRFYRYDPGQSFELHRDGYYRRNDDERSLLTLLVYLNSPERGGSTRVVTLGDVLQIEALTGRALLFAHRLLHEGAAVEAGRKYVLRSDVMYRRVT